MGDGLRWRDRCAEDLGFGLIEMEEQRLKIEEKKREKRGSLAGPVGRRDLGGGVARFGLVRSLAEFLTLSLFLLSLSLFRFLVRKNGFEGKSKV